MLTGFFLLCVIRAEDVATEKTTTTTAVAPTLVDYKTLVTSSFHAEQARLKRESELETDWSDTISVEPHSDHPQRHHIDGDEEEDFDMVVEEEDDDEETDDSEKESEERQAGVPYQARFFRLIPF